MNVKILSSRLILEQRHRSDRVIFSDISDDVHRGTGLSIVIGILSTLLKIRQKLNEYGNRENADKAHHTEGQLEKLLRDNFSLGFFHKRGEGLCCLGIISDNICFTDKTSE